MRGFHFKNSLAIIWLAFSIDLLFGQKKHDHKLKI